MLPPTRVRFAPLCPAGGGRLLHPADPAGASVPHTCELHAGGTCRGSQPPARPAAAGGCARGRPVGHTWPTIETALAHWCVMFDLGCKTRRCLWRRQASLTTHSPSFVTYYPVEQVTRAALAQRTGLEYGKPPRSAPAPPRKAPPAATRISLPTKPAWRIRLGRVAPTFCFVFAPQEARKLTLKLYVGHREVRSCSGAAPPAGTDRGPAAGADSAGADADARGAPAASAAAASGGAGGMGRGWPAGHESGRIQQADYQLPSGINRFLHHLVSAEEPGLCARCLQA